MCLKVEALPQSVVTGRSHVQINVSGFPIFFKSLELPHECVELVEGLLWQGKREDPQEKPDLARIRLPHRVTETRTWDLDATEKGLGAVQYHEGAESKDMWICIKYSGEDGTLQEIRYVGLSTWLQFLLWSCHGQARVRPSEKTVYKLPERPDLHRQFAQSTNMKTEQLISQVGLLVLVVLPAVLAKVAEAGSGKRVPKQVHTKGAVVESENDHNAAETGFGAAGIGGPGKYFQDFYMLQSGPLQIEFGHVCENPNEWEQRYEKKDLAKHRHQGQVRWGDKHGGYGEHYWDYNHAGHGGEGGDDGGSDGGYSEPVPQYHHHSAGGKVTAKRQSPKQTESNEEQRVKRQKNSDVPRFVFDIATGQVVDETTGQVFVLQPIN
ncbi:hypothetical protein L9F63_024146 [Diploptera punctata]|uniref:Uncharacterized protein n=1 Tax=Diploptera punctata TaxID=6984 RepID=A0AAD8E8J8_DIPPU|nr:hypothetical protein L9F63_024146 [Diploptera punctata]